MVYVAAGCERWIAVGARAEGAHLCVRGCGRGDIRGGSAVHCGEVS